MPSWRRKLESTLLRFGGLGAHSICCESARHSPHSRAENRRVRAEEDEELLVTDADAVVHPRAVVVHLDDATLAYAAVMRPRRLEGVAPSHAPRMEHKTYHMSWWEDCETVQSWSARRYSAGGKVYVQDRNVLSSQQSGQYPRRKLRPSQKGRSPHFP